MQALDFRRLAPRSRLALCWSFLWRGVVITFASMAAGAIIGALFGAVLGLVAAALGIPSRAMAGTVQLAGIVIGVGCGLLFFYVYVRWLLTGRLGRFRLVLVEDREASLPQFQHTEPSIIGPL